MPRPRLHNSQAERAAAYRKRLKEKQNTNHSAQLGALHTAIRRGAKKGDIIAAVCIAPTIQQTLEKLINYFQTAK